MIESLSHGLTNKFMHGPTQLLNSTEGEARNGIAAVLGRLFRFNPDNTHE